MHYYRSIIIALLPTLFFISVSASLNTTPEIILARKLHELIQSGYFEQALAMLNNCQLSNSDIIPSNSQALLTAVKQDDVAWLKQLLCRGIINWQDIDKNTALHVAITHKYISIVELLLSSGANVNLQDEKGNTPLHKAVVSNDIELVKLLLVYGANLDIPNALGTTPLQWACNITTYKNLDITRLLILYKATF